MRRLEYRTVVAIIGLLHATMALDFTWPLQDDPVQCFQDSSPFTLQCPEGSVVAVSVYAGTPGELNGTNTCKQAPTDCLGYPNFPTIKVDFRENLCLWKSNMCQFTWNSLLTFPGPMVRQLTECNSAEAKYVVAKGFQCLDATHIHTLCEYHSIVELSTDSSTYLTSPAYPRQLTDWVAKNCSRTVKTEPGYGIRIEILAMDLGGTDAGNGLEPGDEDGCTRSGNNHVTVTSPSDAMTSQDGVPSTNKRYLCGREAEVMDYTASSVTVALNLFAGNDDLGFALKIQRFKLPTKIPPTEAVEITTAQTTTKTTRDKGWSTTDDITRHPGDHDTSEKWKTVAVAMIVVAAILALVLIGCQLRHTWCKRGGYRECRALMHCRDSDGSYNIESVPPPEKTLNNFNENHHFEGSEFRSERNNNTRSNALHDSGMSDVDSISKSSSIAM